MQKQYALSIDHVSKTLGGQKRINDISIHCEYGKIYGLIGPNGSGKTTLLKLITGLYQPDEGVILVGGLNPIKDYKKVRRQFGLLPQDTAIYPELTAKQNLEFHGALYFNDMKKLNQRIQEILNLIDLKDRQNEPVGRFSGGMKRRLGIGLALLNDPQLIFFDEPTLGVDVHNSHRIWEYIRTLKEQNKTVIVTTNVMSEADHLCDKIFIIDHGIKICEGTPDELKESIGEKPVTIVKKPSLDDVFVYYTGGDSKEAE